MIAVGIFTLQRYARTLANHICHGRIGRSCQAIVVAVVIGLCFIGSAAAQDGEDNARVHQLIVQGLDASYDDLFQSSPGDTLSSEYLEETIDHILNRLSNDGYLAATATLDSVQPGAEGFTVIVVVRQGQLTKIGEVRLDGDSRTKPRIVKEISSVHPGSKASEVALHEVRKAVIRAGLHEQVGTPGFELTKDSSANVVIPVVSRSPGSFDMILGYLPDARGAGSQMVGNGHIELFNAFGAGRLFGAQISRLPGQASSVALKAEDPLFVGLPIRLSGSFEGYQEDSTFSKTALGLGALLRLDRNTEVGVRVSHEATSPGQSGSSIISGVQRVASSTSDFWGVEFRIQRVDNPQQPRKGLFVESILQRGRRQGKRSSINSAGDTLRIASRDVQERLSLSTRLYQPVWQKWSIVAGLDMKLIRSEDLDESELFRLGGATSLRGYDEDRFRGQTVVRSLIEVRLFVDDISYGFAFYDLGYIDSGQRKGSEGVRESVNWYPGFGFGFVLKTALGPVNISYAMNTEDPLSQGKVHIGMSFGL